MHETRLALEEEGEFGHFLFEGSVGLEFELDDFRDWVGHGEREGFVLR